MLCGRLLGLFGAICPDSNACLTSAGSTRDELMRERARRKLGKLILRCASALCLSRAATPLSRGVKPMSAIFCAHGKTVDWG